MKIRNILFYLFALSSLAFKVAVCSDSDLKNIRGIMASMDEKTAQEILDSMHQHQRNNSHKDEMSGSNQLGDIQVSYEIELNDVAPRHEQIHKYRSELHASLADFQFDYPIKKSHLENLLATETSDEAAKKQEQKRFRNDLISKSFGVATICAILNTPAAIDYFYPTPQKRVFVIDDIMAGMAIKSVWTAVVPSVVTGIAGIMAWRQVDHWLHAEERSRFVVLENKFNMAFTDIKKDVTSQLAKRDKEANEQAAATKKLIQDMSEKNEVTTKLVRNALTSFDKAHVEMTSIKTTITSLKESNVAMKSDLARMNPTMQKIYKTMQHMVHQPQVAPAPHHERTKEVTTRQDLLASIHIPQSSNFYDSDDDSDDDNEVIYTVPTSLNQADVKVIHQVENLSHDADAAFKKNNNHHAATHGHLLDFLFHHEKKEHK